MGWYAVAAAAVVSAVSSYQQSQAQAKAADFNAQVARQNVASANAQSQAATMQLQRDQQRKLSAAVAQYGASGVQTDSGSPIDMLQESVRQGVLDRATMGYNYATRATDYQNQSNVYQSQADNYRSSSLLNAGVAGLSSGAMAYGAMGMGGGAAAAGSASASGAAATGSSSWSLSGIADKYSNNLSTMYRGTPIPGLS